jgi:hydroxypyruvate isomerase
MERRNFLTKGLTVAGAASLAGSAVAFQKTNTKQAAGQARPGFRLAYAPHFGMFENSAGKDLIAQLRFMADNGFTALEDNGLMGRTPQVQEQIGKELTRLGMKMGVFVVGFDKWPPQTTLTSGKS